MIISNLYPDTDAGVKTKNSGPSDGPIGQATLVGTTSVAALESFALALFLAFTVGILLNWRLQAELLIEPFDPSLSSQVAVKPAIRIDDCHVAG